jgi:tetratricopeptide (TPR) repeat protein
MKSQKGFLDARITRRFYERIAEDLSRKPIGLEPGAHRERLKALVGSLGEMSFFELLGVAAGSSEEEIHRAYSQLARLVHPSHAERLGMESSLGALELLFERATEAYLTLNDPDRSRVYRMATGIRTTVGGQPTAEQRRQEQVDQAARFYRVAKGLVAEERYYDAVQTLRQAAKLDPKPEYFSLLGECLAQNPHWLNEAIDAYYSGAELAPHDPHLRTALALLLERAGSARRAEEQYQAALTLDPDFADALAGMERIRGRRRQEEVQQDSLWQKVGRWFGRGRSEADSG